MRLAAASAPARDNHPMLIKSLGPVQARVLNTRAVRLIGHWWRQQTPARQDRYATLGPLVSVLLFLAAIMSAFWYLRHEEVEREHEAVQRDTEVAQQQVRLRLLDNQERVMRLARDLVARAADVREFETQAAAFCRDRPEVTQVLWLCPDQRLRAGYAANSQRANELDSDLAPGESPSAGTRGAEVDAAFADAKTVKLALYSRPFFDRSGNGVFQLFVPLVSRDRFQGSLVVEYAAEGIVRYLIAPEISDRHAMVLLSEADEKALASTVVNPKGTRAKRVAISYDVPLTPAGNGLILRGQGYRTSIGLIGNTLFWMVVALSGLTVWMLLGTWRHMRRRLQMQSALVSETNFRRAMENSMLTGMRAMDMEGRITYVNAAFCAMTGFAESELVNCRPPFPHWPPERIEENQRLLQQELHGRSPAGGIEVKVMRKDRTLFDARMYVSPLIDARGQQTGWMTSMTNITEAKRIRDQLSASHERFTTVLEGLDAAVSVLSVQQGDLLFANRSYRLWFGAEAQGHALLAGGDSLAHERHAVEEMEDDLGGLPTQELTEVMSDAREVQIARLNKWFDVRMRYVQWTDGRLAQMLIATDITERRDAEALAAAQAEKAQVTSRLITMGEMASSVAHELNQPLTAISNYCNGMVSRVQNNAIDKADLITALEKTARQAQRAGQIIHRVRAFVKRSEPQRQLTHAQGIVDDVVELAGIELRRRNVAIQTYVAQRLPPVLMDPILIEQVVLNLIKNAAEAIDNAAMPASRRRIELRVVPRHQPDEGGVIEFSVGDTGPGLKDEIIARMFEAFFSTKADGLGIGLSLCRSIVESHQGRLRAQNLYNGDKPSGCRFWFTLPVEAPRTDAVLAPNLSVTP